MSSGTSRFLGRHMTAGENLIDHLNSSSAISAESNQLQTQPCFATDLGSPLGLPPTASLSKATSARAGKFQVHTQDYPHEKTFGTPVAKGALGPHGLSSYRKWAQLPSYNASRLESSQTRSKLSQGVSARS